MKNNYSHLENLIKVAEENEVEEYLFYRDRGRNLTVKQLELILLKSSIQPPKDLTTKFTKFITSLLNCNKIRNFRTFGFYFIYSIKFFNYIKIYINYFFFFISYSLINSGMF